MCLQEAVHTVAVIFCFCVFVPCALIGALCSTRRGAAAELYWPEQGGCCADAEQKCNGRRSSPNKDEKGSCASSASESGDESSSDDDAYVSDRDSDDEGLQKMLHLLEEDNANPHSLVLQGKRRRTEVNYRKLNDEMFGDMECYDGEGMDDDFLEEKVKRRRRHAKTVLK
jgi:hypothetical protein